MNKHKIRGMSLCAAVKLYPGCILLDPEDYSRFKYNNIFQNATGHFMIKLGGKLHTMQQAVTDFKYPMVDHKNRLPWDCRKENLRSCTRAQNTANSLKPSTNTSGYKGVSWSKPAAKWKAVISINGKRKTLGYFISAEQDSFVYEMAARQHYKEFAN